MRGDKNESGDLRGLCQPEPATVRGDVNGLRKVKLGFVGCGMMGQIAHLPNYIESDKCEVVALAELRPHLARAVAQKFNIPRVYETHAELARDPEVEAVVEITTDHLHAPIAIDLLNAGKHVLTEKPIATRVSDAARMVEAAEAKGLRLMVTYMKRYDPGIEEAKRIVDRLIETKELGEITFVRAHCFGGDWVCNAGKPITTDEPYPPVTPRLPDWLPAELARPFGGFNNVYCHNVNLIRHLLGDITGVHHAEFGERARVVLLEVAGTVASLETGPLSAHRWDEELKIYFQDGWLEIISAPPLLRNVPAQVRLYKAGKIREMVESFPAWDWGFRRTAEHFLDCIIEGKEPRSSGKDSLKDLEIMEQIFKLHPAVKGR